MVKAAPKKSAPTTNNKSAKKETAKKSAASTKKTDTPAQSKQPKKSATASAASGATAVKPLNFSGATNEQILELFRQLTAYEWKVQESPHAAKAYHTVYQSLKAHIDGGENITSGNDVFHLTGVGQPTAKKIDEYLESKTVQRLHLLKLVAGAELDDAQIDAQFKAAGDFDHKGHHGMKGVPPTVAKVVGKLLDKKTIDAIKAQEDTLIGKSGNELKELARKNDQRVSGTKGELAERLAHQVILGKVARCPNCGGGKPKFDVASANFFCTGYMDELDYIPCGSVFSHEKFGATMREPWTN